MNSLTIVPGSLLDAAQRGNISLAESFLGCDALVIIDSSGSMIGRDASDSRTRHQAARDELRQLQSSLPGRVGVIVFSNTVQFVPGGDYPELNGSTDLAQALQFVKVADDCGIKIIVVSDGDPDDQQKALAVARTFKTRIDAIYIGPERESRGRDFLQQLCKATGGKFVTSDHVAEIAEPVRLMLNGDSR